MPDTAYTLFNQKPMPGLYSAGCMHVLSADPTLLLLSDPHRLHFGKWCIRRRAPSAILRHSQA